MIGRREAASTERMLECNKTITTLDIHTEVSCDESLTAIYHGLEKNSTVRNFALGIIRGKHEAAASEALCQVISRDAVLTSITAKPLNDETRRKRSVCGRRPR
jgi:hypothetical protein